MKATLFILLLILPAGLASAQGTARRLVAPPASITEWVPTRERTGNLVKFSQTNKKLGLTLRSNGLTWADLSGRGFSLVSKAQNIPYEHTIGLPGTHESGPHAATLGKPATQWTEAECYHFGRNVMPVHGLTGDQLNEGYGAMEEAGLVQTNTNTYRWIYEGMRDKAALMNPKAILIGSYETKFNSYEAFRPNGGAWNPNTQANRDALATPAAARAGLWWFGLDVSHYVMPIYQFYPRDHSQEVQYGQAYAIQRLQKACEGWASPGSTLGAWFFTWPIVEGGSLGENFYAFEHPIPAGKLYQHTKVSFSFNSFLSMCMNTFVLSGPKGGIYVWEDGLTFSDADPSKMQIDYSGQYLPADVWKPTAGAPAPVNATRPTMPRRPQGIFNAPIIAAEFYGEMVAAGGENFQFARFKIGGGSWIEPGANNTSVLEAAAQYRGWCMTSQNATGFAVYYTNPYAAISGETITVDLGAGKIVTFDCFKDEPVIIAGSHSGGALTFPRIEAFQ